MTILAIESSTPHASLALWKDGDVVWESEFTSERAHNSRIFAPLEEALSLCDRQLDVIVVGIGPGSYGGVRVGIAVANGFALALGAKTIGVSSLEAIGDTNDYAVIGDARRKSFFLARVTGNKLQGEPELLAEEGLVAGLRGLDQDGVPVCTSDPKLSEQHPAAQLAYPAARRLAMIAAEMTEDEIASAAQKLLQPHYLRAPYITVPKK